MLPQDPHILLSVANMKLRDGSEDLDALCVEMDWDKAELLARLEAAGFAYYADRRSFG